MSFFIGIIIGVLISSILNLYEENKAKKSKEKKSK